MQLWPVVHFFHSLSGGYNSKAAANPPKSEWKKWATGQRSTTCKIGTLVKSSKNNFNFLPVFYLIMCLMKASIDIGKIAILTIWELVSLGGTKTHFGKIALKWCISDMKKYLWLILWCSLWSNPMAQFSLRIKIMSLFLIRRSIFWTC